MEGGVTVIGWFFYLSIKNLDCVEIQIVLEKKLFINLINLYNWFIIKMVQLLPNR